MPAEHPGTADQLDPQGVDERGPGFLDIFGAPNRGCHKSGAPFGSPCTEDHGVLGSVFGPSVFGNSQMA